MGSTGGHFVQGIICLESVWCGLTGSVSAPVWWNPLHCGAFRVNRGRQSRAVTPGPETPSLGSGCQGLPHTDPPGELNHCCVKSQPWTICPESLLLPPWLSLAVLISTSSLPRENNFSSIKFILVKGKPSSCSQKGPVQRFPVFYRIFSVKLQLI